MHGEGPLDRAERLGATIHDGVWAFCYAGGQTPGHEWTPVDGMPLNDAMRFSQPAPLPSRPKNGTPRGR